MLIAIPGIITTKFICVKQARLILVNVRYRAHDIRESEVFVGLRRNPSINGQNILLAVIVVIEKG